MRKLICAIRNGSKKTASSDIKIKALIFIMILNLFRSKGKFAIRHVPIPLRMFECVLVCAVTGAVGNCHNPRRCGVAGESFLASRTGLVRPAKVPAMKGWTIFTEGEPRRQPVAEPLAFTREGAPSLPRTWFQRNCTCHSCRLYINLRLWI